MPFVNKHKSFLKEILIITRVDICSQRILIEKDLMDTFETDRTDITIVMKNGNGL